MTTTTSTTSTASIVSTLGSGSGIDITSLVSKLVDNQFSVKNNQLSAQADKLTAQISGVAKLKSGLTGFDTALSTLVKGGTLTTSASSSNTNVVKATALPGADLSSVSSTIEVKSLASAQVAVTKGDLALKRTDTIGTGTLTITTGSGSPVTIRIDSADATLDGIAAKVNAAGGAVTAKVVTNADGTARLALRGLTGAANAFTVDVAADDSSASPGLGILATGSNGQTDVTAATDARLVVDGVEVTRGRNSISDLVEGVRLDLVGTAPGSLVTIGSSTPLAALSQAVSDLVDTYNQLHTVVSDETNSTSGELARDIGATAMARVLSQLTLTKLVTNAPDGAPTTLAEIGVGTNRDGSLKLDTAQLTNALTRWPGVVEAMFASGTGASGHGLSAALDALTTQATSAGYGLDGSTARLTAAQTAVSNAKDKAASDADALRTRMTQQFAAMDARVASYKATQAFLDQQVKVWTKSND